MIDTSGSPQQVPTSLGAYEIIRPLAKGGMAELFLARSRGIEGFERVVVFKRILPQYANNPQFVRSFLDEAKLVAGMDHPHIAHVFDMGVVGTSYFFTMEYVQGVDVRTLMKRSVATRTELPVELAILIARNIASALHYAHERRGPDDRLLGIVHRDVSPSNIIVSFDGAPKLVDFGIAKSTASSTKTRTGLLKGKIAYLSPEQAMGAAVDRRTDVFALGIVLWEMVTGRRLFKSNNELATIHRIAYEQAPSPCTVKQCSPELERIIMRALALDPAKRFQTAQDLEVELEELARDQRLKQSAIALGSHLRELFADLIATGNDTLTTTVFAELGDGSESGAFEDDEEVPPTVPPTEKSLAVASLSVTPSSLATTNPMPRTPTPAPEQPKTPAAARTTRVPRLLWIAAACGVLAGIAIPVLSSGGDPAPEPATPPPTQSSSPVVVPVTKPPPPDATVETAAIDAAPIEPPDAATVVAEPAEPAPAAAPAPRAADTRKPAVRRPDADKRKPPPKKKPDPDEPPKKKPDYDPDSALPPP